MTLSVIVVALGEDPLAAAALESARAEAPDAELILVLNGVSATTRSWPAEARVVCNAANTGFAAAFNQGLALSRGAWVLSLNPDAHLEAGSLAAALSALEADPCRGAIAFRMLRPDGVTLDSGGVKTNWLWRAKDRGMGLPAAGSCAVAEDVDAPCMAAALFRRTALERARDGAGEVLDERFFAYKEDVDLGWRLRARGFTIHFVPRALAVHARGWKEGSRASVPVHLRRLSFGNRWQVIAKNAAWLALLLRAPFLILFEVLLLCGMLVLEPRTLGGLPRAFALLPGSLRRRVRKAK